MHLSLDYLIDRFEEEANLHTEQAQMNRANGMEPSDSYWRGRAQGLLEAREMLLKVKRY
jgi:hypothetical protein